ncbi:MAG: HlyC/CorC family transporter [Oscillospiraceae bacterium]|nr:HlyC/CorC family transporter [Oscillospiraceae bacterium]
MSTLIILIILLCLSAFFSATETALTGANRIRLKNQAEGGDKKAALALKLIGDYDSALSTLLIANNIVNILASSLTTVFFINLLGASAVGAATAVTTVAVIIFGEVLPKSYANENSEDMIKTSSAFLNFLTKLFSPFVAILNFIKSLLKKKSSEEEEFVPSFSEEELISIIDEIEDEGVLEETQAELVQSAIEFKEIFADEILTPRVDITAVEKGDSLERVKELFLRHNFSRMPVFEDSIDNIIGFISQKDLFSHILKNDIFNWNSLVKPCLYVPPKKKIIDIMQILQKEKMHMAVVTDEYGGTLGILTLEDILEELVGEIWDEHDEITQFIKPLDDGSFEVLGELEVTELYEAILETHTAPVKDYIALSAYLLEKFSKIPEKGESVCDAYFRFTILEVVEHRIIKVKVSLLTEDDFEI